MLEDTFKSLAARYSDDRLLIERHWEEIKNSYTSKSRYYHNLEHLENMRGKILEVKSLLTDFDSVLFALYYHDAVYKVLNKDNEEKSAKLAEKRLKSLKVPGTQIETCVQHILATKAHTSSANPDTKFFTDADLSILGQPWEAYKIYTQQIRKEYSIYPDLLYKPGRRKVLEHFLNMPKIFKTETFFTKFEQQARINVAQDLKEL